VIVNNSLGAAVVCVRTSLGDHHTSSKSIDKMADSKLNLDFEDMMEDDKNTITLNSSREVKLNSPLLRGMDLDLSFAASKNSYEQEGIQEQDMNVVFELPDGSQGESRFKMGQTIEVLKSFVESEYGIPMEEQRLYIDNKLLLNPMSLLDYPEAKGMKSFILIQWNEYELFPDCVSVRCLLYNRRGRDFCSRGRIPTSEFQEISVVWDWS
jgi:hypothetical protein